MPCSIEMFSISKRLIVEVNKMKQLTDMIQNFLISQDIKENSKIPIVTGGSHCTLFPEQMAMCEYIDYVVVGEG